VGYAHGYTPAPPRGEGLRLARGNMGGCR